MTFLKRLFGSKNGKQPQRVRICQECGMPVAEHKDWCSIYRTLQELERKGTAAGQSPATSES